MRKLTWRQVWARRMARSHLVSGGGLLGVARETCGLHAQLMTSAELSFGARGVSRDAVRRALWEKRILVKTASVRGTLHVHAASDLSLFMAAKRGLGHDGPWLEEHGIDERRAWEVRAAIASALEGRRLTRAELNRELEARLGEWARLEGSWNHLVGLGFETGDLLYGPPEGNEVTFVRARDWCSWKDLDPEKAFATVVRRYLATYGPARPEDFAHWFHAPRERVERAFARARLEEVSVEGWRAFMPRVDWRDRGGAVRLLPQYDSYVVGCHPRDVLIPSQRERIFHHGQGPFPALVVDGVVVGTWRRDEKARRVSIEVEPFRKLSASERAAVAREASRVGAFLGLEADLRWR